MKIKNLFLILFTVIIFQASTINAVPHQKEEIPPLLTEAFRELQLTPRLREAVKEFPDHIKEEDKELFETIYEYGRSSFLKKQVILEKNVLKLELDVNALSSACKKVEENKNRKVINEEFFSVYEEVKEDLKILSELVKEILRPQEIDKKRKLFPQKIKLLEIADSLLPKIKKLQKELPTILKQALSLTVRDTKL